MTKRAIVCVTNDLTTDQRVRKTCLTLMRCGYEVVETGRLLPDSLEFNPPYTIRRPKLLFNRGPLFYAEYNLKLFFYLLFSKVDLIFSNDLDTLPSAFLAAKIRKKKLIYDTHEYFTGMPELMARPKKQAVWKTLERMIFPRLQPIITVNDSIADLYRVEYKRDISIVRNIPLTHTIVNVKTRSELDLPHDKKILILQGTGINVDRGAEEAVLSMSYLHDVVLLIIGGGDVLPRLKTLVEIENLQEKVIFKPKMSFAQLREYTMNADLGLAMDKDTNVNYKYSLPNKLFDYIHSGIPVLASDLPEIRKIIDEYHIGYYIPSHNPQEIAETIRQIFADELTYQTKKANTQRAINLLNWENEEKKLIAIIRETER